MATSIAVADEHAGSSAGARFGYGLLAGLNFSDSTGHECTFSCDEVLPGVNLEASFKTKDQLSVGGFLHYRLREHMGLRVEARLTMKGVQSTHSAPAVMFDEAMTPQDVFVQYKVEHTLRYVQVPVLVQMDIPYDNVFKPHVVGGIGVGIQWATSASGSGTAYSDAGAAQTAFTGESDTATASKRVDISVIAGVGTTFPVWRGDLEVGVRYEMSALSAMDGTYSTVFDTTDSLYQPGAIEPIDSVELTDVTMIAESMRHRVFSVVVGYRL